MRRMSVAEYIKVLGISKCRVNVPAESKTVKGEKKHETSFKEIMDKEMEKLYGTSEEAHKGTKRVDEKESVKVGELADTAGRGGQHQPYSGQ